MPYKITNGKSATNTIQGAAKRLLDVTKTATLRGDEMGAS